MYYVHLRLIGKLVGDFLLVISELFLLGVFVLSQHTRLTDGRTDGQTESRQQYCAYASQSHSNKQARWQIHHKWRINFSKGLSLLSTTTDIIYVNKSATETDRKVTGVHVEQHESHQ